jgi:hypothetical protein
VHERLGVLPQQSFKKSDQFFHKRNRQQVWRHEGYQEVQVSKEIIPEVQETVEPPFVPAPAPVPAPKPFNAEQHRQTWTWVRPSAQTSASNAAAMDIDENASS